VALGARLRLEAVVQEAEAGAEALCKKTKQNNCQQDNEYLDTDTHICDIHAHAYIYIIYKYIDIYV